MENLCKCQTLLCCDNLKKFATLAHANHQLTIAQSKWPLIQFIHKHFDFDGFKDFLKKGFLSYKNIYFLLCILWKLSFYRVLFDILMHSICSTMLLDWNLIFQHFHDLKIYKILIKFSFKFPIFTISLKMCEKKNEYLFLEDGVYRMISCIKLKSSEKLMCREKWVGKMSVFLCSSLHVFVRTCYVCAVSL
jgi:hypothetical protein